MQIETSQQIAVRLSAAAEQAGLKPTTFCVRHFNNSRLVKRLGEGRPISTATYQQIIDVIGPPPTKEEDAA